MLVYGLTVRVDTGGMEARLGARRPEEARQRRQGDRWRTRVLVIELVGRGLVGILRSNLLGDSVCGLLGHGPLHARLLRLDPRCGRQLGAVKGGWFKVGMRVVGDERVLRSVRAPVVTAG